MYDNLTLYRLTTGELVVAQEVKSMPEGYEVKNPHSIVEEPSQDGQPPRVMLQPSIPHQDNEIVLINRDTMVLTTKAPENICKGYKQALSNIIMPNQNIQKTGNITNINTSLQP